MTSGVPLDLNVLSSLVSLALSSPALLGSHGPCRVRTSTRARRIEDRASGEVVWGQ